MGNGTHGEAGSWLAGAKWHSRRGGLLVVGNGVVWPVAHHTTDHLAVLVLFPTRGRRNLVHIRCHRRCGGRGRNHLRLHLLMLLLLLLLLLLVQLMVLLLPLHFAATLVHPHAKVLIIPMLAPKPVVVEGVDLVMEAGVWSVGETARVLIHGVLHWCRPVISRVPHAGTIPAAGAAPTAVHVIRCIVPPVLTAVPVVVVPRILVW